MNRVADGATKVIRDVSGKLHSAIDKNQGKRKGAEKKPSRAFPLVRSLRARTVETMRIAS